MKTTFGTHDLTCYILNNHDSIEEIFFGSAEFAGAFVEHQHLFIGRKLHFVGFINGRQLQIGNRRVLSVSGKKGISCLN